MAIHEKEELIPTRFYAKRLPDAEGWQSGRSRRLAKPLYGLIPVSRVRIPAPPPLRPVSVSPDQFLLGLRAAGPSFDSRQALQVCSLDHDASDQHPDAARGEAQGAPGRAQDAEREGGGDRSRAGVSDG